MGLVRDLRKPPKEVVENVRPVGRKVAENVAVQVAATVSVRSVIEELKSHWDQERFDELRALARQKRDDAEARLHEWIESVQAHGPVLPTTEELRERARQMFADSPSLDDIARRAREMTLEPVAAHLLMELQPHPA